VALLWLAAGSAVADPMPDVAAANCVACRSDVGNPRALYAPDEWQALEEGSILLLREDEIHARGDSEANHENFASGLIAHSPRRVWTVLTDFEKWPSFMPHITGTQVTRTSGTRTWVHQTFRIVFLGMQHTTIYQLDPHFGRLSWSLDPTQRHDLKSSQGRWSLIRANDGQQTLVRYGTAVDAGRAVPKFVEDMLTRRSLSSLIINLRSEVERRYGKGSAD
jgi:ribosome-associated toxin RatA of RatAB toxin-antitoxin module